ncbi:MAG: hypothetical protein ACF8XB_17760 [Planctomycetota bacterium JB042]
MGAVGNHLRRASAALVGTTLLLAAAAADAWAQPHSGRDATVPKAEEPPRRFRLNYEGARRYLLRDGDPANEDAPYVIAVAGGAKLWFEDYFLTARNILIWVDDGSLSSAPIEGDANEGREDRFPYGVEPPIERRDAPPDDFALIQDPSGAPLHLTSGQVREVFAEGDVYITQGRNRTFQAEKAYFNVLENRSLIIEGEIRSDIASLSLAAPTGSGNVAADDGRAPAPIVIRAAEIRGVSKGLWEAENAKVTTSTLGRPGYHIAMDRMRYEELVTQLGGRVTGYGNRFVLGDVPLLTVPYFQVRTGVQSPVPLIGFATGVSSQFGLFVETRWGNVFEEEGNEFNRRIGVDGSFQGLWFADVNLYSARGPGLGGGLEYETTDGSDRKYFGRTEFLFVYDFSGDDRTSSARRFDDDEEHPGLRGHFLSQNRVFLPDDWIFDTEVNWVSDEGFLKEFKENLADEMKDPETYVYLRKADHDAMASALARFRLNSWQSQTQYLPQFTYDVVSRPIAEIGTFGEGTDAHEPVRLYWEHRSEAGIVNRRLGDDPRNEDEDGTALRVDDVERLRAPFEIGNFGVDPYVENRLTVWAGDGERDGDSEIREAVTFGFNANTQYWRVEPDVESEYWNIHGLRHVVIPSLRYRWTFAATTDPEDLVPYDRVERFGKLHALVPGVTSRYQTKRMTRNGPETVTFLEFDVQQALVFDNDRDDDHDTLGDFHVEGRWRPDMDVYLLRNSALSSSLDYNWNDSTLDRFRVEFRTEPGPDFYSRVAYSWSQRGRVAPTLALDGIPFSRRLRDEPLSSLTLEFGYQATRRWEFVVLKQFDFTGGSSGGENVLILRRSTHDWMFEIGLGSSGAGPGLGFTVTPIAFFQRGERDRFRTALSDGYDLTPVFDDPFYASGRAYGESSAGDDDRP